jgi:hypothetical protein
MMKRKELEESVKIAKKEVVSKKAALKETCQK